MFGLPLLHQRMPVSPFFWRTPQSVDPCAMSGYLELGHKIQKKPRAHHQARRKSINPNFWVRLSSGGVGVFHVNGWGPKSSACPSKFRETKLWAGYPVILAGISRGCLKNVRKSFCAILGPYKKIKLALTPPNPPKTTNFMGIEVFLQKEPKNQAPIKFAQPFPTLETRENVNREWNPQVRMTISWQSGTGGKISGEGKTYRKTPAQNQFWISRTYATLPICPRLFFPLENGSWPDQSCFLTTPTLKWFWRVHSSSPPNRTIRFAPPLCRCPMYFSRETMLSSENESGQVRPRQGTEICNFGAPSPLDFFCFFSNYIYVQFSKTSPLKSGESSEKSSGENRVKSCHVCGCHGFFGPEWSFHATFMNISTRSISMPQQGGAMKAGVYERKRRQTNACNCRHAQMSGSLKGNRKCRQIHANASKRGQTQTNLKQNNYIREKK